jgi:hypothetical protein
MREVCHESQEALIATVDRILMYEILKEEYAKNLEIIEEKWQCCVDANGDFFTGVKSVIDLDGE